jgi:uncharacterized membrane protein
VAARPGHRRRSRERPGRAGPRRPGGRGQPRRRREAVVVGLVAAPGLAHDLARRVADDVEAALRRRFPEVAWRVEVRREPLAAASQTDVDLVEVARRRMLAEGWKLAICLTDLPLLVGSRPVTAHASVTHGVGLVSVPALGAVALEARVREAVLRLVDGLLGERLDDDAADGGRRPGRERRRRRERIRERLEELASPVGRADVEEGRTVRFVTAVVRGNLRLLVGMVRANRPWRLVAGLSRALVAALGVDIFAVASPGVWKISAGMTFARLLAICLASLVITCVSLIVAHSLWEDAPNPHARDRVVLFNLATCLTVALGVLSLYLALFAINVVAGEVLIAPGVLRGQLGGPVDLGTYLQLAWLVSSLATLGGALGAALENDRAVRAAAYGRHADERWESAG